MASKGFKRPLEDTDLRMSSLGTVMTMGCSTFVPAVTKHGQDHEKEESKCR